MDAIYKKLIDPIISNTIFKLEFLDKLSSSKLKMVKTSENNDEISKLIEEHRREEKLLAIYLNEKSNIKSEDIEDYKENNDNLNKINSKIKEIVKSIHNNLSEDKPNEKDNINRFKEKRKKLVDRLKNLREKLLTTNTSNSCIDDFDKSIKDEESEWNKLRDLKAEEKKLNDELKKQNKEIKDKNAEKLRYKMDSEEKTRKEKDKLNNLKAKQDMKQQSMSQEFESIYDTTKKNCEKEITSLIEQYKYQDEQEQMYVITSKYILEKIGIYIANNNKRNEDSDVKKTRPWDTTETNKKIKELNETLEIMREDVNKLQRDYNEYNAKIDEEKKIRKEKEENKRKEEERKLNQIEAANIIRKIVKAHSEVSKAKKGKRKGK